MRNPYEKVNWDNVTQIHSLCHTHIENQEQFDNAYTKGIRHFAISNYEPAKVTYPLDDISNYWHYNNVPSDVIATPNTETRDFSNHRGHMNTVGSFFESDLPYNQTWQRLYDESKALEQYEGLSFVTLNHPQRPVAYFDEMVARSDYDPNRTLIEVYNMGTESRGLGGFVFDMWHRILNTGRMIFGTFNPDHGTEYFEIEEFKGRNILLVNELTEQECLRAYKEGRFYGSMYGIISFKRIEVVNDTLHVETDDAEHIKFVTNTGEYTSQGNVASVELNGFNFIRVEAHSENDSIYSQPIMFKAYDYEKEKKKEMHKKLLLL